MGRGWASGLSRQLLSSVRVTWYWLDLVRVNSAASVAGSQTCRRIGKQWEGGGAGAGVIDGKGGGFYGFGGFEDKADLGSHQGVDDAFGRRFGAGESWV